MVVERIERQIPSLVKWLADRDCQRDDWSAAIRREQELTKFLEQLHGKDDYRVGDARRRGKYYGSLRSLPLADARQLVKADEQYEKGCTCCDHRDYLCAATTGCVAVEPDGLGTADACPVQDVPEPNVAAFGRKGSLGGRTVDAKRGLSAGQAPSHRKGCSGGLALRYGPTGLLRILAVHAARQNAQTEKSWDQRLVAFVVTHDRPVEMVSLGTTQKIGLAIDAWRESFGSAPLAQSAARYLPPLHLAAAGAETGQIANRPDLA